MNKCSDKKDKQFIIISIIIFIIMMVIYYPGWDRNKFVSGGYYRFAAIFSKIPLEKFLNAKINSRVIYSKDGVDATVTVGQTLNSDTLQNNFLQINGKTEGGLNDLSTMVLAAYYPLIYNTNPKKAAVIGFGTGISLNVINKAGIKDLTLIEIEPEVIKAGRFFKYWNDSIYEDTTIKTIIDDARHFLNKSTEKFDIIVTEPSNPWISGVANLFTEEALKLYKKRLNDKGILSFWIPLYNLENNEFKSLAATVDSVFKYSHAYMLSGDIIFICSDSPLLFSIDKAKKIIENPSLKWYNRRMLIENWYELYGLCVMNTNRIKKYAAASFTNTDDNMYIELHLPKILFSPYHDADAVYKKIVAQSINLNIPLDYSSDTLFYLPAEEYSLPFQTGIWKLVEQGSRIDHRIIVYMNRYQLEILITFYHKFLNTQRLLEIELNATTTVSGYDFNKLKKDMYKDFPPPYINFGQGVIMDNPAVFLMVSSKGLNYADQCIIAWYDRRTKLKNIIRFSTIQKNTFLKKDIIEALVKGIHR